MICVFCKRHVFVNTDEINQCECGADIQYLNIVKIDIFKLYFNDNFEIVKNSKDPSKYRIVTDGYEFFDIDELDKNQGKIKTLVELDYVPDININNIGEFVKRYLKLKAFA